MILTIKQFFSMSFLCVEKVYGEFSGYLAIRLGDLKSRSTGVFKSEKLNQYMVG